MSKTRTEYKNEARSLYELLVDSKPVKDFMAGKISLNKMNQKCILAIAKWLRERDKRKHGIKTTKKFSYIYAYDPIIKKRVVHVIDKDIAISMVTGHKFKFEGFKKKK